LKFQKITRFAIIAIVITAIAVTVTTAAVLSNNQTVPLNGTLNAVNLSVYSDSSCTIPATSLNVGTLNPGGTATQTVYVKNTGNIAETLTMSTANWNPSNASTSLTLSWNRQSYVLPAGQNIQATLTLTAAANTGSLTSFSCDATLTGTQ